MIAFENTTSFLFILYLVISSNFLAQTFNCRVQQLFMSSMLVKHILGFMTLVFFVIIASVSDSISFINTFLISLGVYMWFIASTRLHLTTWLLLITTLGVIYILDMYQKKTDTVDPKKDEEIQYAKKILSVFALLVTIIGILLYAGEKRIEYGSDFKLLTFILGKPICRGDSPTPTMIENIQGLFGISPKKYINTNRV